MFFSYLSFVQASRPDHIYSIIGKKKIYTCISLPEIKKVNTLGSYYKYFLRGKGEKWKSKP